MAGMKLNFFFFSRKCWQTISFFFFLTYLQLQICLLSMCHIKPIQVVPIFKKCIKSQMRKIYSSTAKCPNTSRNQHIKQLTLLKHFTAHKMVSTTVTVISSLWISQMCICQLFLWWDFFLPKSSSLLDIPKKKVPLTTLVILPFQWLLKINLVTRFWWSTPDLLCQLPPLQVVSLKGFLFK